MASSGIETISLCLAASRKTVPTQSSAGLQNFSKHWAPIYQATQRHGGKSIITYNTGENRDLLITAFQDFHRKAQGVTDSVHEKYSSHMRLRLQSIICRKGQIVDN